MQPLLPAAPPALAAPLSGLGTWSRPHDRPSQVALGLAVALLAIALVPGGPRWLASLVDFSAVSDLSRRRRFLAVAGFVAAFLSLGYIAFYLRGGPRDALAPVYWLQGRAMSHGQLAWSVPEPTASFRAEHLIAGLPDRVAGIFPPGYPLLLAAGFLVGAPMLIGPLLAALLVVATWGLARELALASGESDARAEAIARIAAGLSVVSASLRMVTADALPQGATAVAVAVALASALMARRLAEPRLFGLAGLAVGGVLATHPPSAVAVGAIIVALAVGSSARGRAVGWALAAAVPGVLLLLAADRASAGRFLASPVAAYFAPLVATAGADEHGLVVGMLVRLRAHLADVDNLEPLALLALVPVVLRPRLRASALAALVIGGQLLVTAPFGQESSARVLTGIVPIEQALIALALARLFPRALASAAVATLAIAIAGFACHTSNDHARIAAGDLGRPSYEPDVAREGNVTSGLLYFDDDSGFELAFDPAVPASHGVQAVRMRGDDHDRLLYDSLGHPQIHRYTATATGGTVVAWTPPNAGSDTWRFEAESDWPPIAGPRTHVDLLEKTAPCLSDARALEVIPPPDGEGTVTLSLPVPRGPTPPERRTWSVAPRVLQRSSGGSATLELVTALGGPVVAHWTWDDASKVPACTDLPAQTVELGGEVTRAWLVVRARGGAVAIDKTTMRPK